jgi:uncharacterized protein (TIGR00251 family)
MIDLRDVDGGTTLRVRVVPRAARDELAGEREGALVVRLTAPPVEGAANAALTRLLARRLRLAPSAVSVARGAKGREKVLLVSGLGADVVRARLEEP